MPQITRFSVRSSGRDINAVRRPDRARALAKAPLVEPVAIDPTSLKKAELVELAESRGKSTAGTKAELAKRLTDETSDG